MEVEDILKEFDRLEDTEKSHYWRWQFLGCFLKDDKIKLQQMKTKKKLAKKSNRKIVDSIFADHENTGVKK